MIVFRMHRPFSAPLDTTGSFLFSGRWHWQGMRVIYTAEHASLAVLEALIHASGEEMPRRSITRIHIPDELGIERAPWLEVPESRQFGDDWARAGRSAVLRVESVAVNRMESNFVLNPGHPDFARIRHDEPEEFIFDRRYFTGVGLF